MKTLKPLIGLLLFFFFSFFLVVNLVFVPVAYAAKTTPTSTTVTWKGNGTTGGFCSSFENDPDLNPASGKQGWLFILTSPYTSGPYNLTYSFSDGTNNINTPPVVQKIVGSVHIIVYTAIDAKLLSASVTNGTSNSILTVSHCEKAIRPLQVSKTANTTFTRTWTWGIDKSADQSDLGALQPNDVKTVNYIATVSAGSQDSDWVVNGTITVTNPAGNPNATIASVTDVLSSFGSVSGVNCGVIFPYILSAGSVLNCTYTQVLGGAVNQTNTATVVTTGLVPGGSSSAVPVAFDSPTTETDECVTVNDTNSKGPQGVVVCSADSPKTFNYSTTFSKDGASDVKLVCGSNTYNNTASFVTNDTSTAGSDSWTVTANVQCNTFWCSPGYWGSAAKFDIYSYINAHKVVTPPASIAGADLYSSITGIVPAALKAGSPSNPSLGDVLGSPSTYGGPANNSISDYFAYLLGWGGTQATGDNCPINTFGNPN